jgi:hypothetical protein
MSRVFVVSAYSSFPDRLLDQKKLSADIFKLFSRCYIDV